jgi:hypothetical protein
MIRMILCPGTGLTLIHLPVDDGSTCTLQRSFQRQCQPLYYKKAPHVQVRAAAPEEHLQSIICSRSTGGVGSAEAHEQRKWYQWDGRTG